MASFRLGRAMLYIFVITLVVLFFLTSRAVLQSDQYTSYTSQSEDYSSQHNERIINNDADGATQNVLCETCERNSLELQETKVVAQETKVVSQERDDDQIQGSDFDSILSSVANGEFDSETGKSDEQDGGMNNDIDETQISSESVSASDHKPSRGNQPKKHKNVLFIISDDLRPQLSPYKGQFSPNPFSSFQMITPNLDALSKRSLLLTRAYNQFGTCNPSRASFMTSRRPDTTKVWDLQSYWRDTGGNFTTIPQFFKEQGYITAGLGKVYHPGTAGADDAISWTEPFYIAPFTHHWQFGGISWQSISKEARADKPLPDEDVTTEAIRLLRKFGPKAKTGEQPFFMGVGYQKPHIPFVCPEEFHQLYPIDSIQLANNSDVPKNYVQLAWNAPEPGTFRDMIQYNCSARGKDPCFLPKNASVRIRKAYFSCVSYIDSLVGQLVSELDELGLTDSTIISFIGDHGYHLGENGMIGKSTNFEQASHTPMMVTIPGRTDQGITSNSIVELLDLYPTIVEGAGFDNLPTCPPDSSKVELCVEGTSLMPLVKEPTSDIKKVALSQVGRRGSMGYALRTDRFRYIEWPVLNIIKLSGHDIELFEYHKDWDTLLGVELYDHHVDPEENVNVAGDQEYADYKQQLSEILHQSINSSTIINTRISYLYT